MCQTPNCFSFPHVFISSDQTTTYLSKLYLFYLLNVKATSVPKQIQFPSFFKVLPMQSGKYIAYAFTSTKSSECIESVLRYVKAGIEDAVACQITHIPVQNITGINGKYYACVD